MAGAAGEGIAELGKHRFQRRQQLGADVVSGEPGVGIGGVFHKCLPLSSQPGAKARAADLQKGPVVVQRPTLPVGGHAAYARHARAAAQREQDGLNLVVRMLRECYRLNSARRIFHLRQRLKSLVTGDAGSILGALAGGGLGVDMRHLQRKAQPRAGSAAVLLECLRRLLQAMVDMQGHHLTGPLAGASQ